MINSTYQVIDYEKSCPVCGCGSLCRVYQYNDFSVLHCAACDVSWRSNMYSVDKIVDLYTTQEYAEHPYFQPGEHVDMDETRKGNYVRAIEVIRRMVDGRRLLDVGCGSGGFVAMAKQEGWDVQGVELSPQLAERCRADTGVDVLTSSFEQAELGLERYDVLSFWDIIEHVRNPMLCLRKARDVLRPGGIALFCTPNERSLLARLGKVLYSLGYHYPSYALHPPNHTFFFSDRGLSRMLERAGLRVQMIYSQQAYFEHSPLASVVQKAGIRIVEALATPLDACYESVCVARLIDRS